MKPRVLHAPTEAALNTWAAQKRALYLTKSQPVASVLGQIQTERVAAGEGDFRVRQKWPEVYTGDGLIVQRIVATLRELPRLVLTTYWVAKWPWKVPIPQQAEAVGISRRDFWTQLHVAEAVVDSGLQLHQDWTKAAALDAQKPTR